MNFFVYEEGRVACSLIFGKNTVPLNNVGLNVYGHLGLFCALNKPICDW